MQLLNLVWEHVAGETSFSMTAVASSSLEHDDNTASTSEAVPPGSVDRTYLTMSLAEHNQGMKTSVANSIKYLLGSDGDLVQFDELRIQLKQTKGHVRHRTTNIRQYKELSEKIIAKIKLLKSAKSAEIEVIEKRHYQKKGVLLAKTRGTPYYNLLKERELANKILRLM